ncbi:hypothetical protein NA57DRAFT_80465 [Rhizodiscina lignyota]|uniref:Alpha-taxilin n=1 Tax=Rhizodiscina lignyota TaxID=1504668 RepID=A0A9P4M5P9_9PEZI|nr:hypothetical protein NA57DRAFT_80465 [Rhizodiscina lignyota]
MGDSRSSSLSQSATPVDAPVSTPNASSSTAAKKGKGKKNADPLDATKAIQARISQLEQDKAGEKDQEAEIDFAAKQHNRELKKSLDRLADPLQKLDAVQKKYSQLFREMKTTEREMQKAKKRGDQLQKEKEAIKSELNKANSAKDKLEKLSRDTNSENKRLRSDITRLERDEMRMRDELHDRLERMVFEVEDAAQANQQPPQESAANMEVEELFRQKFKSFIEQYELRELQFHSLLRTKELELQLYQTRLEEYRKREQMESSKSSQLTRQVSTFSQTETELRSQLNIYVEKFKQVEDTLNNSNDLFLTFRKEMEEMSKKTKRLEKENLNLTRKQEAANKNILTMAEDRTNTQKELELLRKKNENLEKLCRGMQAQGRGQVSVPDAEDEEGTESEYEYDDEEEESLGEEYEDDTEEEALEVRPRPFGPVPPPPPPPQAINGKTHQPVAGRQMNGKVNGVKG